MTTLQYLAGALSDYNGEGPGGLLTGWRNTLNANTSLPRPAISGIRLYERYLYLSPHPRLPMRTFLHSRNGASKGAALMIVLAFVVLLTGLTLAYFSRTTTDRQLAQSSYNDTNADLARPQRA